MTTIAAAAAAATFEQEEMRVVKRDGSIEIVAFDKILTRLRRLGNEASLKINYTTLAMKVIDQLFDKISTTKIDELCADQCASLASTHPDYNTLAGRIVVSNHHRNTTESFSTVMRQLYEFRDNHGVQCPMISDDLYRIVQERGAELDAICDFSRDYLIDFFGFKTLERSYLTKINRITAERPQHMWLRVSLGIHGTNVENTENLDLDAVKETYEYMSQKYFTHATPTLFNAGTPRPQLSSCFLLSMEEDSIDGIYNTLKDCANISKWAGGIGLHIHNVRAQGSHIRGTNGSSNGIVPMLRVFNNTAKYVDQCVTGDTLILTDAGYRPIKEIREGDVLSNRYVPEPTDFSKSDFYLANDTKDVDDSISIRSRPAFSQKNAQVKKVVVHPAKPDTKILIISSVSIKDPTAVTTLRITPGHPVYALRQEHFQDPRAIGEWTEAGHLQEGDRLLFGENKHSYRIVVKIEHAVCNEPLYDLEIDTTDGASPNYLTSNALLHNGGGKRNGSFAIYLEPWHADTEMFLQMRKNHGDEELKARDLFYALWIPDLFMKRVKEGAQWTLMCPDECPGLSDCYGAEFVELYTKYEREGRGKKTMPARDLWFQVLDAQMETGTPYILYKDACNEKSNQKNLGTIKSSNLCVAPETLVLTDQGHVEIKDICGQMVTVWNGVEWSNVLVKKTGENQPLIEVKTSDGASLHCTKYHKFYTMVYSVDAGWTVVIKDAQELRPGDQLYRCRFPVIETHQDFVFSKLADLIDTFGGTVTDGILAVVSSEYDKLKELKYLLQTCGTNAHLEFGANPERLRRSGVATLTGEDLSSQVNEKSARNRKNAQMWKLVILSDGFHSLAFRGFTCKTLDVSAVAIYNPLAGPLIEPDVKITEIVDNDRRDDTYCFNEPLRHMAVFNGILTGQCTEIVEYSAPDETAVCNLASIALPMFVDPLNKTFDYGLLHKVTKIATRNLNKVIDINFYPTEKTRRSNFRHRPVGLGVQGLADTFIQMGFPFYSDEAKDLNRKIFETIYHAAVEQSIELAKTLGAYETFTGSPASKGILQFDMWSVEPSNRYDWQQIKADLQEYGMRNSLLVAPMPTASTSQILGFNECIEPITSNIYSRRTMAGEFILANRYLMTDLIDLGLWNDKIKNNIIANNGSVQHIETIPQEIRDKYKTVWEIPMRHLIDMAADRGAYICQSQSLNLWLEDPNYNTLTSMHFYSWTKGLKTGIYYLRRRAKHQAQQFTIEPENRVGVQQEEHDICEYCSA